MQGVRLGAIPDKCYPDYKLKVIFGAYKWDPQVGDSNTVSKHAVLLDKETAKELETQALKLYHETVAIERALLKNLKLAKKLGLACDILKNLKKIDDYDGSKHVRLMRFDFHPTDNGWVVSEVNSDVPGGFAEASVLPKIANKFFDGYCPAANTSEILYNAFKAKMADSKAATFVHATSYSDDRQVMECIADCFVKNGDKTVFCSPDQIKFVGKKAFCILSGFEGEVSGIVRFFPLEWFNCINKKGRGFYDCETVSCNHPVAILTQSKRLPLIWDKLGVNIQTWKKLLPETADPKSLKNDEGWIYKPAFGRVGEGITVKGTVSDKELIKIKKSVKKYPIDWVAQREFKSIPLTCDESKFHLCVGVFVIDGINAGFYGRINSYARIDSNAMDIPVLVKE